MINVVGMGAAVLGLQATVGALVPKALTTSSVPYYQGIPPGQSPVLALDIFLVQVYHYLFSIRSFSFLLTVDVSCFGIPKWSGFIMELGKFVLCISVRRTLEHQMLSICKLHKC